MSSFTTPLIVEFVSDNHWRIAKEFDYAMGAKDSDRVIHVRVGFETDFASIPRIFWNILSPTGDYGKAAVIHDYLYKNGGRWNFNQYTAYKLLTRKECDDVFLEGMVVLKVNPIVRWIIYNAVRLFAGLAFKKSLEKGL